MTKTDRLFCIGAVFGFALGVTLGVAMGAGVKWAKEHDIVDEAEALLRRYNRKAE